MPFIPQEVFANNPAGTVTSGGTTTPSAGTTETWAVNVTAAFPAAEYGAQQFHIADQATGFGSEMITVQACPGGTGSQTWTVQRGAEGTTPLAHTAGFGISQVVTAGVLATLGYPPWQFPVQAYGAQGDGKIGTGGTGTSGTSTFTDSGANFVNATAPNGDVGKVIIINQGTGGTSAAPFCGTISAVNSSTSVTLSANLGATCASAPYVYGTDDASAINAAVSAAAAWAVSTGNFKAQVMFQPALYMLGSLIQSTTQQWSPYNTGLNYTYNTHIPVPFTTQYSRKLVLDLIGVGDASEPDFWGSTVPGAQGTCLVSAVSAASQPNGTYGQQSVIGGPTGQTNIGTGGISGGGFANVLVNVAGLQVVMPYNAQQYGMDFRWIGQANIQTGAALCFAPVNAGSQTVGGVWINSTTMQSLSGNPAVGLAMPLCQNNDNSNISLFSVEGVATGVSFSEHTSIQRLATIYCYNGITVSWLPSGTQQHGGTITYWSCEGCFNGVLTSADSTHMYMLNILSADFEVMIGAYVNDSSNNLTGVMYWFDISQWNPTVSPGIVGGANYKIINGHMYPGIWAAASGLGIGAPPSAPSSGTAQQNTAYRDATVYASASTSITSWTVGPSSASLATTTVITVTAGANVAVPLRVPSGWWYKVTYSGTLTTTWVLD